MGTGSQVLVLLSCSVIGWAAQGERGLGSEAKEDPEAINSLEPGTCQQSVLLATEWKLHKGRSEQYAHIHGYHTCVLLVHNAFW